MTEDELVGYGMSWWYVHQLDGHNFKQAPGAGDRQRGLVCYSLWGCKESDVTK